jgi:hypothetical protein
VSGSTVGQQVGADTGSASVPVSAGLPRGPVRSGRDCADGVGTLLSVLIRPGHAIISFGFRRVLATMLI